MKAWLYVLMGCLVLFLSVPVVHGSDRDMEILLKKLQEKGILSSEEASQIAQETRKGAEEEKKELQAAVAKDSRLPEWITNAKFKGDLRLRYQNEDKEDNGQGSRGRGRMRLRLGVETKVADNVTAGFGLASGSGDPRSTNQTYENVFEKKQINIDYAYAQWKPLTWLSLMGGKFENPLWRPSDLLWDSDITPEGAALKIDAPLADNVNLLFNSGFFVLSESSAGKDQLMYAFQPVIKWDITRNMLVRAGAAYYMFDNVKGGTPNSDWSKGTNTRDGDGTLRYDYDAFAYSAEVGFKNLFGSCIPYVGVFGEYVDNPDPPRDNTGYIYGVSFGEPKISKFADWNFEYTYRKLDKDAWLDVFPDSDFYGGSTGVKGHRGKFAFGLSKNVSLGFAYYNSELINKSSGSNKKEDLFQSDINFKF